MKIYRHNCYTEKNRSKNNNVISLKKNFTQIKDSEQKSKEKDDWRNKKINLNYFENRNLIKELRAKYLPESEIKNKSQAILNINLSNINNKNDIKDSYQEKKDSVLNNNSKESCSLILNDGNKSSKYNLENNEIEKYKDDIIKEKNNENIDNKKNKVKTTKFKTQKKIIIENRFYTEIINSNILLDKNLLLNAQYGIAASSKYNDKKILNNNNNINYKKIFNIHSLKNRNEYLMRNDKNQFINISSKKNEIYSINQNNRESSTNKEMKSLNNKEIIENININKEKKSDNFDNKNIDGNNEILKLENQKMKKEIKNYEKLITPLINYINDINRILDQREINPDDITEIIKNDYPSKSSFYIDNLICHLNNSKDEIAFHLDESSKNYNKRKKERNKKIVNLKQFQLKRRRQNRSAGDSKNVSYFDNNINNIRLYKNGRGNFFYEDSSDKYIFDYYKDRNINCSACLIGNNNSQRGYSPSICCHLDDEKEENNNENDDLKEN